MKKTALHQSGDQEDERSGSRPDGASSELHRQADVASYCADFTTELAQLARSSKLDLLAYLLDVAHLEARTRQRHLSADAGES